MRINKKQTMGNVLARLGSLNLVCQQIEREKERFKDKVVDGEYQILTYVIFGPVYICCYYYF